MKGDKTLEEICRLLIKPLLPHKHPDMDDISFLGECFEVDKIKIKVFKVRKTATYLVKKRISFENWFHIPTVKEIAKGDLIFVRSDERRDYIEVDVLNRKKKEPITLDRESMEEFRFSSFEWLRLLANSEELLCDESHVFNLPN